MPNEGINAKSGRETGYLWKTCAALVLVVTASVATAQAQKPLLLRDPSVSQTQVTFSYAGSIWVANRDGSNVRRLTSGGHEGKPIFSPDGSQVAFTGDYDGNRGIYVVAAAGGDPRRLTYHPADLDVIGWTPDGKRIVFSSRRTAFAEGVVQLFTVPIEGGFAAPIPLARASEGSFSSDGSRIAYVPNIQWQKAWKRYRGGQTKPIWIANLSDSSIQAKIPRDNSNDFNPMWCAIGRVRRISWQGLSAVSVFPGCGSVTRVLEGSIGGVLVSDLEPRWSFGGPSSSLRCRLG